MTKQKPRPPYKSPGDDGIVLPTAEAMMNLLHDTGDPAPSFAAAVYASKRLAAAIFVTLGLVMGDELEDHPEDAKKLAGEMRTLAQFIDPATRGGMLLAVEAGNGERNGRADRPGQAAR